MIESSSSAQLASSRSGVSLALALSMKYLADEYFLAGNREDAETMYAQAAIILKEDFSTDQDTPSTVTLLRQELDYRMNLLARKADFWGFLFSMTPSIPPQKLDSLARHSQQLGEINKELQQIVDLMQTKQKDTFAFDLDAQRAQIDQQVAEFDGRKAILNEDFQRRRIDRVQQRLQDLVEMNKHLQMQQQQAQQQIQQEQQHLNGLVLDGIGKAAGIPVDLSGLAQGKSMKDAVMSAGASLLGKPEFLQSLKNVSSAAEQAVEVYQKASDVLNKVKSTAAEAERLEDIIRKPTFESAAALGQQIYGNLEPNVKQQWDSVVSATKPLVPLVEFSRNNATVDHAIRQYLSQFPEMGDVSALTFHEMENKLGSILDSAGASQEAKAHEIFDQVLVNTKGEREKVQRQITQLAIGLQYAQQNALPGLKIDQPGRFVDEIKGALEEDFDSAVKQTTSQVSQALDQGQKVYAQMTVEAQSQWAVVIGTRRPLPLLIELVKNNAALDRSVRSYLSQYPQPTDLSKLSVDEVTARLRAVLPTVPAADGTQPQLVYDEILSRLSEDDRKQVNKQLVILAVGKLDSTGAKGDVSGSYKKDVASRADAASNTPAGTRPSPPSPVNSGSAALQAALGGAIKAAFPEAAIAEMAIQFVAGNINVIGLADRINSLSDQIAKNTVESAHLHDLEDESQLQASLAQLDKQISESRYTGARNQVRSLRTAMDEAAAAGEEQRAKVAYRLSTAFYLAETLRQDFDSFDRAVGIWTGALEHSRGNVTDALLRDPQNLRLAVDQDIHLFDWFGAERDLERQRNNIDLLANHWSQLTTVSKDMCQRLGCTDKNPRMGAVSQSADIRLRENVSDEDWKRFLKWQNAGGTINGKLQPFTLSLLILPEGVPGRAPNVLPHHGLRLVTVRLGELATSSRGDSKSVPVTALTQTDAVHVIHSGFSYIPIKDTTTDTFRYVKEIYRPLDSISLQPPDPSKDKNDDLMKRWAVPGGYSVLPFEGYGLYTVWFVQFDATDRNFHLRDVVLKFIYQYNDNVDETDLVQGPSYTETLQPETGLPTLLNTRYLRTLGSSAEVRAKIKSWAAQSSGSSSATWPFGTPESDNPNFAKKLAAEDTPLDKWLH